MCLCPQGAWPAVNVNTEHDAGESVWFLVLELSVLSHSLSPLASFSTPERREDIIITSKSSGVTEANIVKRRDAFRSQWDSERLAFMFSGSFALHSGEHHSQEQQQRHRHQTSHSAQTPTRKSKNHVTACQKCGVNTTL